MRIFTAIVSVAFVQVLCAQNPTQLTFEEAIKIGMDRNVSLNQQKNQLQTSQIQRESGYGALLPSVNLQARFTRQTGQQPNADGGELINVSSNNLSAGLNANLNLFNGLRSLNTIGQANNQLSAQGYLVKRTEQDVVSLIGNQYLQVLLDQELLKIADENLKSQSTLLEQMQGFFDVGARAITDVYNQDALMKAAQVTHIRARNALQNDKALLAQTLQLDPAQDFEVVYPATKNEITFYQKMSLDSLVNIAMNNRADLEQLKYQVKANQYSYKSLASGFLPSLSLFANYGSFYYSLIPENFTTQFRTLNPSMSYGANLNIPIFSRLQNRSQRAVSLMQYKNSELNRQNLEKTIKLDVQRARNNFINAIENLAASQSQFQAGELALRTQRESYDLGISAQVALAQANQTYVSGAAAKAQAEVTLIFQRIMLEYSLGTLRVEDLIGQ